MKTLSEYKVTLYCCMINDCSKTYSTKFNLKRHMDVFHLKNKKHKCSICEKSFVSQQNLKEHIFIHNKVKPYHCEYCGDYFRQLSQLSLHKRNHMFAEMTDTLCLDFTEYKTIL